jgi:transposase
MSNRIIFTKTDINEIVHQYTVLNLSCEQIGKSFNMSKMPINKLLKDLNLLKKGKSDGKKIILSEEQKNKIKELYVVEHKNREEISKITKLNKSYIEKILSKSNYRRTKGEGTTIGMLKRFSGISYEDFLKNLNDFKKYKRKVVSITKKQPIHNLLNFNKRGVSGVDGNYHLDHKFSIVEGFKQKISPWIIGNIINLEFIPWEENVKKRTKCSINEEELKIF